MWNGSRVRPRRGKHPLTAVADRFGAGSPARGREARRGQRGNAKAARSRQTGRRREAGLRTSPTAGGFEAGTALKPTEAPDQGQSRRGAVDAAATVCSKRPEVLELWGAGRLKRSPDIRRTDGDTASYRENVGTRASAGSARVSASRERRPPQGGARHAEGEANGRREQLRFGSARTLVWATIYPSARVPGKVAASAAA
jgi:hypothetical protein